jgi:hypothetical protein
MGVISFQVAQVDVVLETQLRGSAVVEELFGNVDVVTAFRRRGR